jgi:hypothetical protein
MVSSYMLSYYPIVVHSAIPPEREVISLYALKSKLDLFIYFSIETQVRIKSNFLIKRKNRSLFHVQ